LNTSPVLVRNHGLSVQPSASPMDEQLASWKEIAAYLRRDVRTVQRWEKTEGLPVKRHRHRELESVYALKSELDSWREGRQPLRIPEASSAPAAKARRRLAVLPFDNLSGDPEQEYFSDGLTEEMISKLGRLHPERLGVLARTTMMKYKGTTKSINEIDSELGVDYFLEGSVRRDDRRVRITAQLIKVSDQTHLWAESYDRTVEDILAVQIEVAEKIARSLAVELLPEEHAALARSSTTNAAAHDAYLRGRYFWSKRTEENFSKAIESFQQAVDIDPGYAAAYAGLADCFDTLGWYGALPADEAYRKAKAAALHALQIDDRLAEAHAALAYAKHFYEWNWEEIEKEYRRALELDSNYVTAHHWYALFLASMGRFGEALVQMDCALDLDPLSLVINSHLGWILYFARLNERAVKQLQETVKIDPQFAVGRYFLGMAYEQSQQYDAAIKEFEAARAFGGEHPGPIASLVHASGLAGKMSDAKRHLESLKDTARRRHVSPYFFAQAYVGMGENGNAFTWLDHAYQERSGWLVNLNIDPAMDPLRSDRRFADLLRRVGLPIK
jgi:TolB-like protein/Tfp pilus assembly protein PilF